MPHWIRYPARSLHVDLDGKGNLRITFGDSDEVWTAERADARIETDSNGDIRVEFVASNRRVKA